MGLIDQWHRQLSYLRVSITDRCNLRCIYCRTGPSFQMLSHKDILSYEEILGVIQAGIYLGIKKVRITGGEPLVRRGVFDFLKELSYMTDLEDISFTSNGILLERHIQDIVNARINRINISLDTLNPEKYFAITGANRWHRVWKGLIAAYDAGIDPIKLNVVAMKGINDDEWVALAQLTQQYPFWVRFIELMPVGHSDLFSQRWVSAETIKNSIEKHLGPLTPVKRQSHDGPAERFKLTNGLGEIGFIHAISHHFCQTCNRLRLTANGFLRACLLSDQQIDIRTTIRKGGTDEEIQQLLITAVNNKPMSHPIRISCNDQMVNIGG
ncbi:MAG: Molybdenum cofactor biosynthesis protein A [Candidatus Magnetoglobus multicellularis str. Araruama]|uniref:GTP 3',8-cyclase n=1 Tax=Candidatus Magnetoglobus multicellularis str. Araruama TaxID=890399 RepID=A0A1V1PCG6_9BACT|nr:MAG: Molybdenum cofactor biosynthesis protein A [Candidatus Magnetoglobus multicellularis str. Araruama]